MENNINLAQLNFLLGLKFSSRIQGFLRRNRERLEKMHMFSKHSYAENAAGTQLYQDG